MKPSHYSVQIASQAWEPASRPINCTTPEGAAELVRILLSAREDEPMQLVVQKEYTLEDKPK